MDFDLKIWKSKLGENLAGWKERFQRAGITTFYYGLAATSLLPVIQAYHSGEVVPSLVALGGVSAGVGANLLANKIQTWKDKSEVEIASDLQNSPELKETLDDLLEKMETLASAQSNLRTDAERRWFEEIIQRELKDTGSRITYRATLIGDGAIAQGNGAMALGKNAKYIAGNYTENKYEAPDPKQIEADKNETARHAYLERMRRHCQVLPLAALGGEDGTGDEITLDDVYVDLDTSIYIKSSDLADLRAGKKVRLTESAIAKETPELLARRDEKKDVESLPLWDAVRATPRAVVLGDPGAGKSTFARKLLGLQAAVLLRQCDSLPGFTPNLLPVLIVLRELAVNLDPQHLDGLPADARKDELLDLVHRHLEKDLKRTSAEASTSLILNALESGRVLLVLDGLDEVPQKTRRNVRQLVSALLSEYRIERLVITSRIRSYVGEAVFENLQTFTIREFDEEKIQGFVKAWYNTQAHMGHIPERDRDTRIQDLSQAAVSENLREISSNPMMLTSMAIIHQKEIGLPRERVRLYKLVVSVLLNRWQKHKLGEDQLVPSKELAAFLTDEIRLLSAMEHLAYEAHRAGQEKDSADLPRMTALEILERKEYLGNIGIAEEFLDYADQRSGLLKGNGGELDKPTSYSFPHRTFQEYLAGCYMVRDRLPWREYFQRASEGEYWSLAAQLGAEELYYNRRAKHTVLDLAYHLLPDEANTEQQARAALWSGMVARVADVDEIKADRESPNGGEKYLASLPTRLLALFQSALSPIERAEAGRILAGVGDPRKEVLTVEKMVFCRVLEGEFTMGEKKEERKVSLPEFFISQFPITNAQYNQFVKLDGYKQAKYWKEAQKAGYWKSGEVKAEFWDDKPRIEPANFGSPFNLSNHPVVGISWYEALAFTRWLDEQVHARGQIIVIDEKSPVKLNATLHISLPSEAEWEKASRGRDGRQYPWLGEFNTDFANVSETEINTTSAVGCFPKGKSPYGILDMSGNVWEWTRSNYKDGKEDFLSSDSRTLRGGSFRDQSENARCASRSRSLPDPGPINYGFRVVVSPFLSSS